MTARKSRRESRRDWIVWRVVAPSLLAFLPITRSLPYQPATASSSLPPLSTMPAAKRGPASGEDGKPAKQRKTAKAAAPLAPTSFEHFSKLPNELQTRIVELACLSPVTSSAASNASSPIGAQLDRPTILGIALVSRDFYAQVAPLIYARVRLERPSRLKLFQQTLSARPALGRLVRSLHMGPDDALPSWWWPLDQGKPPARQSLDAMLFGGPYYLLRSGLRGTAEDEAALPVWCKPDRQWSVNKANKDCRAQAVFAALWAASRALNAHLTNEGVGWNGEPIGSVSSGASVDSKTRVVRSSAETAEPCPPLACLVRLGCQADGSPSLPRSLSDANSLN